MCLSIPGRVIAVDGALAQVEQKDRVAWFNALAQPDLKAGDYVLTHANLIIAIIAEPEALAILQATEEMQALRELSEPE